MLLRSRFIQCNVFNINVCSNEQYLVDFRFMRDDVAKIAELCSLKRGSTVRNRYKIDPITATCVFLRGLAAPCRWRDLELKFFFHTCSVQTVLGNYGEFYKLKCSLIISANVLY